MHGGPGEPQQAKLCPGEKVLPPRAKHPVLPDPGREAGQQPGVPQEPAEMLSCAGHSLIPDSSHRASRGRDKTKVPNEVCEQKRKRDLTVCGHFL